MSDEMLDCQDVQIHKLTCEQCDCGAEATHFVTVDYRNAGIQCHVGEPLCYACAVDLASRIRDSLPKPWNKKFPDPDHNKVTP